VLVAIPAVVIIARLYPLVLRALLRAFGGRASATGFVGLARAARTSLTPALPAFALVLALTLAAFAGMVMGAITRGEIAASWQAVGGDARIQTAGGGAAIVTPTARRAIGAVPGVRQTAAAWLSSWTLPGGQQVDGIAVDPASYAALVATTQTWPQVPAAKLAFRAGQPVPVLASRSVAASLAGAATVITQAGLPPLRVRLAGILSGTPAAPGDQAFFIVPISAIRGETAPPLNVLLITGSGISASALAATAQQILPGSVTNTRSAALDALSAAPLQHGIYLIFALAIAVAAGLGLVVMVLELALGTTDRELILARLATMGLPGRQRFRLTLLEIGPSLLAAAVAATGCALALPRLLGPALDLSVFTGSGAPVRVLPDVTSFVLPLAVLALLAVVALAIETRAQQRRGIAAQLRVDT
jgi:putative ABC transport system permease protein